MAVLSSVYWFGPAESALEGLHIEELCVVNGADRLFSCLDERFPDLETHDKIGESLDNVFRFEGRQGSAYGGIHGSLSGTLREGDMRGGLSCQTLLAAT